MKSSSSLAPARRPARRDGLLAQLIELAPAVRRAFDVRLDAEQRALWRSLTVHQLEALAALEGGPRTMRQLCEQLEISESAGTALVDRLTARGLVERRADPADRRIVRIVTSEPARAMVSQYRALKRTRIATLLADVPTDDLATLVRVYETVVRTDRGGQP